MKRNHLLLLALLTIAFSATAQMDKTILKDIENIEGKVINWRHYFHENPELSNREFNTAKKNSGTS